MPQAGLPDSGRATWSRGLGPISPHTYLDTRGHRLDTQRMRAAVSTHTTCAGPRPGPSTRHAGARPVPGLALEAHGWRVRLPRVHQLPRSRADPPRSTCPNRAAHVLTSRPRRARQNVSRWAPRGAIPPEVSGATWRHSAHLIPGHLACLRPIARRPAPRRTPAKVVLSTPVVSRSKHAFGLRQPGCMRLLARFSLRARERECTANGPGVVAGLSVVAGPGVVAGPEWWTAQRGGRAWCWRSR